MTMGVTGELVEPRLGLAGAVPLREVGVVILTGLAAFVLLALATYSPFDSAWTYSSSHSEIRNLVGSSGAFAADILLYLLGRIAFVIPPLLVVFGVRLLVRRGEEFVWERAALRLAGALVTLCCLATLLALHWPAGDLPAGVGGVIGTAFADAGLPLFHWVGLTLLLVTLLLVAAQATLGFSWFEVLESVGRTVVAGCGFFIAVFERGRNRWDSFRDSRQARALEREQQRIADSVPGGSGFPAKPAAATVPQSTALRSTSTQTASSASGATAGVAVPVVTSAKAVAPKTAPAPRVPLPKKGGDKVPAGKPKGELPGLELLDDADNDPSLGRSEESLQTMARLLEMRLKDFNIDGEVVGILPGPVVTRFELQPAPGVKVQRITSLVKDLARSLAVIGVRVVEVIPGKSVVGIEIPNEHREMVRLKELLVAENYQKAESPLTLALGKDIAGNPVVADISKMPHLLVAGTTGSGKSVGVNSMLLSILYRAQPEEVRLILVDPKMLELSIYEGIPHLLTPVVTDMKDAAHALNWCVGEMERRYKLMAALGVRNLAGYNDRVTSEDIPDPLWPADSDEAAPLLERLPFIVVVIDEFADMMMIVGKKVEQLIARIAQKARAAGIHLVLATQRPSVDVITGLIKANIPSRIGFQVSSKIDSRTILDQGGAEQLLGHGDMLYLPPGTAVPNRVHGAFVSDDEVHRLVADWKLRGEPDYRPEVLTGGDDEPFVQIDSAGDTEQEDELYDEAVAFVLESRRASTSSVQRKLRVGYNRAARLIDAMEAAGVISAMNSNGSREILVPTARE